LRLLITGSSGYVGANFMDEYILKYDFYKFSLLKKPLENLQFNNIDVVLHCAALVHQGKENCFQEYYNANVKYPVNLAKEAKKNGVKQFVFISTVAVYGEGKSIVTEDTACYPNTPYGKSKYMAEVELRKLEEDGFVISIVRTPMVYGPNSPGNMRALISLVGRVRVIPLGSIENERSFVYIVNLINFIDCVITKRKSGLFLACDDETLSTSKLISLIAKGLGKKVILIRVPFFKSILKSIKPSMYNSLYGTLKINNNMTIEELNYHNKVGVEEGVMLMLKGEEYEEKN
jgi:nucleoside-diphosphate-sugar epimerase